MELLINKRCANWIFLAIFLPMLTASLFIGSYHAANDGFNEIGFPFTYYREYTGKINDSDIEIGFIKKNITYNIFLVLMLSFLSFIFIKKRFNFKKTK